jgi:Dehydrogenases (flavoproteins)
MQGSNVIVAINKDPNAPIFEFSDLGVVGDLHAIVPQLTELVRRGAGRERQTLRLSAAVVSGGGDRRADRPGRRADRRRHRDRGAGPAGLAAAIRLGQLMEEDPATAETLGDVPVAVLEKGKAPGSHLLSGAVVNPRGLQRLYRGRKRLDEMPLSNMVEAESVLFLTRSKAIRIPTPPTMVNDRNYVVSLSQLGRWLAEEAEAGGATVLPETAVEKLLVDAGRVVGVRTGDRGRGRRGEELSNFEPGSDIAARVTILAEGTQGHLTSAALSQFGLESDNPQVWALGVKEVWRVAEAARPCDPHDGLASARGAEVPRVRRLVHLPAR